MFQGAARVQVYLQGGVIQPYFNQGNLPQFWVNESWTEQNINAKYPRLTNSIHNNPTTDISGVRKMLRISPSIGVSTIREEDTDAIEMYERAKEEFVYDKG